MNDDDRLKLINHLNHAMKDILAVQSRLIMWSVNSEEDYETLLGDLKWAEGWFQIIQDDICRLM